MSFCTKCGEPIFYGPRGCACSRRGQPNIEIDELLIRDAHPDNFPPMTPKSVVERIEDKLNVEGLAQGETVTEQALRIAVKALAAEYWPHIEANCKERRKEALAEVARVLGAVE